MDQEGRWELSDGALWLIDTVGSRHAPTASEVYEALVQRTPAQPWIPTSCAGLRASRYPLFPSLSVLPSGDGVPTYAIVGSIKHKRLTLNFCDLERGYAIAGGVWYPLDPESTRDVLALLHEHGLEPGPARSLRSFLALRMAQAQGRSVEDQTLDVAISPLAFGPRSTGKPKGVLADLYPYQLSGWRWIAFLLSEGVGGLLADEMGLGKTLQVISALSDSGGSVLFPALIVVPGSLLENWKREFSKFAPHIRVLKHHGLLRTGRPADLLGYDVVVTTYDNAVTDNSLLNMVDWKVVLLDEAQYIRNPNAQRTMAVKRLRRGVGLAITGTPVQNRLLDLWSILDFAVPGYLGAAGDFAAKFRDHADAAKALEPLVSPLMLRRRVTDVAQDLPARIDIPQLIELTEGECSAYERERERILVEYGAAATLVALTALRRFCAHPLLIDGASENPDPTAFSKFRRLAEVVSEIFELGEKVLVFTSFTRMADLISAYLGRSHSVFTGVIDGRLPIEERQPLIDSFSSVAGPAALVLNPQAGGAGLNITAANHVVHYNPEWNPAMEDQASARAYRRGQTRPVTIHRLLIASTVEEVIDDRLQRKRGLAEAAVVGLEGKDEDYADILKALQMSAARA